MDQFNLAKFLTEHRLTRLGRLSEQTPSKDSSEMKLSQLTYERLKEEFPELDTRDAFGSREYILLPKDVGQSQRIHNKVEFENWKTETLRRWKNLLNYKGQTEAVVDLDVKIVPDRKAQHQVEITEPGYKEYELGVGKSMQARLDSPDSSGRRMSLDEEETFEEGIHDRNILSAPHTNIKTPSDSKGKYRPSTTRSLKALANFGPKEDPQAGEAELSEEEIAQQSITGEQGEPQIADDFSKYNSVEELMKEIENSTNEAAHKHKMERVKAAYESLEAKAASLEEGEHAAYIAPTKIKEMKTSAKKLRKMYESLSKIYEKRYAKKATKKADAESMM